MNNRPLAKEFFDAAVKAFSYMPKVDGTDEQPTYYSISFGSSLVKISISYDIRDEAVDCVIDELWDSTKKRKVDLPQYCDFYGYLVEERGYRGSLREFRKDVDSTPKWHVEVNALAGAVKHFFSEEVAG